MSCFIIIGTFGSHKGHTQLSVGCGEQQACLLNLTRYCAELIICSLLQCFTQSWNTENFKSIDWNQRDTHAHTLAHTVTHSLSLPHTYTHLSVERSETQREGNRKRDVEMLMLTRTHKPALTHTPW